MSSDGRKNRLPRAPQNATWRYTVGPLNVTLRVTDDGTNYNGEVSVSLGEGPGEVVLAETISRRHYGQGVKNFRYFFEGVLVSRFTMIRDFGAENAEESEALREEMAEHLASA